MIYKGFYSSIQVHFGMRGKLYLYFGKEMVATRDTIICWHMARLNPYICMYLYFQIIPDSNGQQKFIVIFWLHTVDKPEPSIVARFLRILKSSNCIQIENSCS